MTITAHAPDEGYQNSPGSNDLQPGDIVTMITLITKREFQARFVEMCAHEQYVRIQMDGGWKIEVPRSRIIAVDRSGREVAP